MADRSPIEWTDATWNPVRGCTRVSEGCRHCYAEGVAARFSGPGQAYEGLADRSRPGSKWTGRVILVDHLLTLPLTWRKPRRIFVNSMSDLFHEDLPDDQIDRVFAVMALARQHTLQVLTKRADRMRDYLSHPMVLMRIARAMACITAQGTLAQMALGREIVAGFETGETWPLRNIWIGVSVEDQDAANQRIPHLLEAPAAVRFLSCEPLLGPVDLRAVWTHCPEHDFASGFCVGPCPARRRIDWVIVGGESGRGARPMHPDWARSLRDQCTAAGTAFFFKQWGAWAPLDQHPARGDWMLIDRHGDVDIPDDRAPDEEQGEIAMVRLGKKDAGRTLDGRTWGELPGRAA